MALRAEPQGEQAIRRVERVSDRRFPRLHVPSAVEGLMALRAEPQGEQAIQEG